MLKRLVPTFVKLSLMMFLVTLSAPFHQVASADSTPAVDQNQTTSDTASSTNSTSVTNGVGSSNEVSPSNTASPSTGTPASGSAPPANSVDYAQVARIHVTQTGPVDALFSARELKYMNSLTSGNGWRGFYLQTGRNLTIELPTPRTIQSISIEMKQQDNIGVFYPTHVDFEAYIDGQWYMLSSQKTQIPTWNKNVTTQVFTSPAYNVKTDRLRIHFPVAAWVFARHIHIYGDNFGDTNSTTLPKLQKAAPDYQGPLSPGDWRAHGIHNMLLVYTGNGAKNGTWTQRDFLPMTADLSKSGEIQSRLFDAMLFVPYDTVKDTQVGWTSYLNDLFARGTQLSALDRAVAETNIFMQRKEPHALDYRDKVIITLPYPNFGAGKWGTVDGTPLNFSGTHDDPAAFTARTEALQWYMKEFLRRWHKANFQHLILAGFYWQSEKVNYGSPDDEKLIGYGVQMVHSIHYPLFWIPYYDAAGLADWQELGFDAAWLQPHYVELGKKADPKRFQNAQTLAQDYGLGIELEIPWQVASNPLFHRLYYDTLRDLNAKGMGVGVSHAVYAASKVLSEAAYSKDRLRRLVYDDTVHFLLGDPTSGG